MGSSTETTQAGPKFASTAAWQELGEYLVAAKKAQGDIPNGPYGGKESVSNLRFGAYESEPIDVVGPGEYSVRIGPLGDDFNFPSSPSAFGFSAPPDVTFDYHRYEVKGYERTNGNRYFLVTMSVPDERFKGPYPGFRMWLI